MRTVSTSENTAVVTPAPKASVSTVAAKNAGRLASDRHAWRHAHIWIHSPRVRSARARAADAPPDDWRAATRRDRGFREAAAATPPAIRHRRASFAAASKVAIISAPYVAAYLGWHEPQKGAMKARRHAHGTGRGAHDRLVPAGAGDGAYAARMRVTDERFEPARFRLQNGAAERQQAVVPPSIVLAPSHLSGRARPAGRSRCRACQCRAACRRPCAARRPESRRSHGGRRRSARAGCGTDGPRAAESQPGHEPCVEPRCIGLRRNRHVQGWLKPEIVEAAERKSRPRRRLLSRRPREPARGLPSSKMP